ncbi:endolytic transglycosylase MltG [Brochothrix thermosphacta]|uniref:endolytic transglycosylase MltG n=1 Tax=Brochothrix thermosphacta TaxID=2756 RepID=UPI00265C8F3A|nr:endolytic transglycosylase MltG [Brochothrix thermosphacta]WKK68194.1 hypothetical protein Q0G00_07670 [Brochothrix thermosphacta]
MTREAYRWLGIGFLVAALFVLGFKLFGNDATAGSKKEAAPETKTAAQTKEQADWKKKYEDLLAETETAKLEKEDKAEEETKKEASKKDDKKETDSADISIGSGEPASDVAKKLKESGMISDAEYFTEFLRNNGYEKFIRNGTYTIKKSMNLDDIAKTITGQQ